MARPLCIEYPEYRRFVEALGGKDYESPLNGVVGSTILGNDGFINDIKETHLNHKHTDRNVPALREFTERPTIEQIAAEVAMMLENEPALSKRVKLYLCHRHTGKRLKEIGEYFKVTESGVSQARHRVAVALEKDKKLSVIVESIKQKLNLSKV